MLDGVLKHVFIRKNFWIGIGIMLFGIVMFSQTNSSDPVNNLYPKFVFGLSVLLGILIAIQSIMEKKSIDKVKELKFYALEIILIVLLIATVLVIKHLGFYVSIFMSTFVLFLILKQSFSVKTVVTSLFYSIGLLVTAYFLFTFLLGIRMPTGLFI